MQYIWALEFSHSDVCSTNGPENFMIKKELSVKKSIISLKAAQMIHLYIINLLILLRRYVGN